MPDTIRVTVIVENGEDRVTYAFRCLDGQVETQYEPVLREWHGVPIPPPAAPKAILFTFRDVIPDLANGWGRMEKELLGEGWEER